MSYNSRCSLAVTDPTTNLPISGLTAAELFIVKEGQLTGRYFVGRFPFCGESRREAPRPMSRCEDESALGQGHMAELCRWLLNCSSEFFACQPARPLVCSARLSQHPCTSHQRINVGRGGGESGWVRSSAPFRISLLPQDGQRPGLDMCLPSKSSVAKGVELWKNCAYG